MFETFGEGKSFQVQTTEHRASKLKRMPTLFPLNPLLFMKVEKKFPCTFRLERHLGAFDEIASSIKAFVWLSQA